MQAVARHASRLSFIIVRGSDTGHAAKIANDMMGGKDQPFIFVVREVPSGTIIPFVQRLEQLWELFFRHFGHLKQRHATVVLMGNTMKEASLFHPNKHASQRRLFRLRPFAEVGLGQGASVGESHEHGDVRRHQAKWLKPAMNILPEKPGHPVGEVPQRPVALIIHHLDSAFRKIYNIRYFYYGKRPFRFQAKKEPQGDDEMARFDLNLLPALDALLTERHVTRAADAIHVSQPTMSGMLQRLRYQFRDEILVRVGRNMELTPFAANLAGPLREALLGLNRLAQAVPNFDPPTSTRTFTLMASDYCVMTFLPKVLHRLAAEAPHVRLEVQPMDGPVSKLIAGDIDLCITADDWRLMQIEAPKDLLRSDILFSDDFVCIVDKDHPISDRPTVSEYWSYPHIQVKMGGGLDTLEDQSVRDYMPQYRPSFAVGDFMAVPYIVQGSILIGVIQRRLADLVQAHLPLRTFLPPTPINDINETLIWHSRSSSDPAHEWIRAIILDEGKAVTCSEVVQTMRFRMEAGEDPLRVPEIA